MKHRIVVLGAGYAGANAASRLAHRLHPDDVEITVVNADPDFAERVRMHQLAVGQRLTRRPLAELFAGTGIVLRIARVGSVDVDRQLVHVHEHGSEIEIGYDTLVYALGSTAGSNGVPGVAEYAHTVTDPRTALRLRDRLSELDSGATVLVVGGGLTGIEAATEIAESRPDLAVTLAVRTSLGDRLSERARRHLDAVFERLGITVRTHTGIARIDAAGATTTEDQVVPADVTVWTAGFAVHPIAAATPLTVAPSGRIMVDRTMRSISHPDVYAVGDAALADGPGIEPFRMSCASGIPMAWQAADAIAARLTTRRVPRVPIFYVTQCISLGRHDALLQFVTPDDRPRNVVLKGRRAARYKETICKGAALIAAHPAAAAPLSRHRHLTTTPEIQGTQSAAESSISFDTIR
ncbi:NAD(P)/FAD-dependent oxidoreductase [Nocardia macrotermitis]|uniref:NADH dehydrogenase-like protein YjlD n=1 Tax=Nocardia macrotermitis TaxID=2585198 RepID=A0A7K0D8R7_9NOCA|nr:FAD-dependent oxidoreductase [Nocardia macrotermitis]MQY21989.1 NADH dehydrogenase-like protein YjlD [Nocardia macrotermitis]